MHCNKDNLPPNKVELIVIIILPIHIIINIVEKTIPVAFFDVNVNTIPNIKHIINGPHKSHCFNSFCFSSYVVGIATIFIFK